MPDPRYQPTRESLRRLADLPPTVQAGITMLAAGYVAYVIFALCLPLGLADFRMDLSPNALILLIWICIGSLALSMTLWFWASRELGVTAPSRPQLEVGPGRDDPQALLANLRDLQDETGRQESAYGVMRDVPGLFGGRAVVRL